MSKYTIISVDIMFDTKRCLYIIILKVSHKPCLMQKLLTRITFAFRIFLHENEKNCTRMTYAQTHCNRCGCSFLYKVVYLNCFS